MRYHNITKDDMLNGPGLRVVLWVAGCEHKCKGCQNPITWDKEGGIELDESVKEELFEQLRKPYTQGITFSGGDPLAPYNREAVGELIKSIREEFGDTKDIWAYTGYFWTEVKKLDLVKDIDVLVDGKFVERLKDDSLHWIGSSNQNIIDVKKSLKRSRITRVKQTGGRLK